MLLIILVAPLSNWRTNFYYARWKHLIEVMLSTLFVHSAVQNFHELCKQQERFTSSLTWKQMTTNRVNLFFLRADWEGRIDSSLRSLVLCLCNCSWMHMLFPYRYPNPVRRYDPLHWGLLQQCKHLKKKKDYINDAWTWVYQNKSFFIPLTYQNKCWTRNSF